MGLVDKIKSDVKKSGSNKGKIFFVRDGQKARVRFLADMDDGIEVVFHDSFEQGINVPCREHFGKECQYCEDDSLRTRSNYAWPVYNYETKEVQILMYPVNNYTPVPALMAMYETYGTLTDRDYVIGVTGKQQSKTFSVIPMDKQKFRNTKAKPLSEKAMLDIINKAFPDDDEDDDPKPKRSKKKVVEDVDDDWGEEESSEYEEMTPKELYKLCKERSIEAEPKKPAKYYINLLEEYDEAQDDWGDDEEEDEDYDDEEWEDE